MTGLSLEYLQLSHFRSHKALRLETDARPVAIFGSNGAGKTNVLEAVSMLSPGRGLRRAAAEDMARRPEALGWKISARMRSLHQLHDIETRAETGQGRSVKIDEKPATQAALGRVSRILWLVPSMDRLWIEGADGRRRFLDRMTLSFEPGHAEATLTYEKAMRERNRLLKDQVRDDHWYRAIEAQMAEAGLTILNNRRAAISALLAAQAGGETSFPTADLALIHAEGADTPDTIEGFVVAMAEGRNRDMAVGRSLIGPHRADLHAIYSAKNVTARDCSTGEQKALLISLILANARALKDSFGAPPILLLDEIAAHLDATRRAALYDEICALGAQAWMTGTGLELFDSLAGRATYLEVSEQDGTSVVTST